MQGSALQATDLMRVQELGSVEVSPDGESVAYVKRSLHLVEGRYEYRDHLCLTGAQWTHGTQTAREPHWHPDGSRLAFVREVDGVPQIFILPVSGGEAYQLTHFPRGACTPRWSPDGRKMLFSSFFGEGDLPGHPCWPEERPGRAFGDVGNAEPDPGGELVQIRAWLAANRRRHDPRVLTHLDFEGEKELVADPQFRHYLVLDLVRGGEPQGITRGFHSFSGGRWVPGTDKVVVCGNRSPLPPDRYRANELFLVDSEVRPLLRLDGYTLSEPQVSPDGQWVAFLADRLEDFNYSQTRIGCCRLDAPEDTTRLLTFDLDRVASRPRWSRDGEFIYFTAASGGGYPLCRVALEPSPVEFLTGCETGVGSFDLGIDRVFYVLTDSANPYELWTARLPGADAPERLTDHNLEWVRKKRVSPCRPRSVARDEFEVQYWVMEPAERVPGEKYPLVVELHGGPDAMFGPGEPTTWHEFQFLASRGFGLMYVNPRGSAGYGYAFQRGNFQDWGPGPGGGVSAAVSDAVENLPWVDPDRLVVTGGSYGGFLTAWLIGQDDRFKAAVAQRGVYDLATFLGEGNQWRLVPDDFGVLPWEETLGGEGSDFLARNSPIHFVSRMQTPLLLMHGDSDLRTGVSQSEMLYRALKLLGRPVEYVRYPGAGHELSRSGDPGQRLDRLLRIYEFFARFT